MNKKARAAQIALMTERARAWMRENPGKAAEVHIFDSRIAYHGLMRLPLDLAVAEKFIHCDECGQEFVQALLQDDLSPTVSMYLAMREKLEKDVADRKSE
jgi:hypothetical protein